VRPKEKTDRTVSVGQVVKDLLLTIEKKSEITEDELLRVWVDAVGEVGAKNSTPVSLNRGVLGVMVKNSSWAQELSLKKRWVLKKIQTAFGKDRVQDIRFKTGQL
jgi:predicted nucleic acid-binding Zn ribbon protein